MSVYDWEQRKFGSVWKKSSEKNTELKYSNTEIISVAQLKESVADRESSDTYMKSYNVFHVGDIAFEGNKSKDFSFGRFVLNDLKDGLVSHVFNVYRPRVSLNNQYMKVYINNEQVMKHVLVKATTKTLMMTTLNTKDIDKQVISIPCDLEQIKIGIFFKQLDKTITLHQRKLEILKMQKKHFLRQMFPSESFRVPDVRFKEFNYAWRVCKLGEMINQHDEIVSGGMGFPVATSSRKGLFLQNQYFDGERIGTDSDMNFHKVPIGYITYRHMSDDSIFKFNKNTFNTPVLVSKEYPVFASKIETYQDFLLYHLNNSLDFLKFSTIQKLGGTRVRLYYKTLETYKLSIPSNIEAVKIGDFFKQLDTAITLHQRRLDHLKKMKKAFLQLIFI